MARPRRRPSAIEDAKKNGEPVKAPVEVEATRNSNTAPVVNIEVPKSAGETKVEIPVTNVKPGTVAVLVHPDGTEEIIKNSVPTEDGIQLTVNGGVTVKIVDNPKDFIDTREHWSRDQVNFVAARELFQGVGDNQFGAGRPMTRGMVNTILARLVGVDTTPAAGQNWCDKGICVSELRYITVEAARAGRAEISLKGKIRTILLPQKLCRKLRKYARKNKIASGEIFLTRSRSGLSRKQIWAEMKALCGQAGIAPTKVFPHNLRHLFARTFYKVCCDVVKLADLLGHSSVETTRIYLISSGADHARQLEQLGLVR